MGINPADIHKMVADLAQAWNARSPEGVAMIYAEDARFVINRGEPMIGRADIAAMAAGFMADFPDMVLTNDHIQTAGDHAIYTWTFEGHHLETGHLAKFRGWEEWEIGEDLKVISSLGWYDEADYQRKVQGIANSP